MEVTVGIDLGTTNTLACYLKKGKPTLVRFKGKKLLPSVLYVEDNGDIVIGQEAKKKGILDPNNRIRSSKTYMGDFSKTWTCRGKTFTPTEVATEILQEVKRGIIKKLKCSEDDTINAVITVPAYFNSNQTDETKKAGEKAGFNVMQIITEPMAAAIAAVKELDLDKKIFVVDLGGGTFDLSVLEANQSNHSYIALDIDGDKKLGGDDFDKRVQDYLIDIIEDDLGIDLSSQEASGLDYAEYYSMIGRVLEAAETAKIDLSDEESTNIAIMNLFTYNGKQYDLEITMTREDFDEVCSELYDRITSRIRKFIQRSNKFTVNELEAIILAGGSCYIPRIQEEVQKIFNIPTDTQMDRSTMVAVGACFVAESQKGGVAIDVQDVLSHSLGIEIMHNNKNLLSKLLLKGEAYPCEKTKKYTTVYDNQDSIPINIYEAASDCENEEDISKHDFYGSFILDGIEIAKAGKPNIKVTFRYDKSRCLYVTATDEKTGSSRNIKIRKGEKATEASEKAPIDFMLLLDSSGSMYGRALSQAKKACYSLIDEMIDFRFHRLGLIDFSSSAHRLCNLTQNVALLKENIETITASGGTNMLDALQLAYGELKNSKNEKVVIMVTDGVPTSNPISTLAYARDIKKESVRLVTIGAGSGIDFVFLEKLASIDDAYELQNMTELRETFKDVILKITEK